ncbi:hypothetical protein [Marichromatium sp. AB31]|uniref:hypothetical protein n=1 Tax=Marichromatium sp. AB31 TaxID=2483362 RepID=UPI000F417E3F|nr:hypothetical protein [Marichromatium sp. AB31]RNE88394.1 hypothetical protein EBL84_16530 [Marichromatium sp. AB31]
MFHRRTQYPPPSGNYSVKVKRGDSWRNHRNCRLQISVGHQYHEAEKLSATIEWATNRFTPEQGSQIFLCVNDTLQRYNSMSKDNITEKKALEQSIELGNEWIERNSCFFSKTRNLHLSRWDFWRSHKDYKKSLDSTYKLYDRNIEFHNAIDKNAYVFWERQKNRNRSSKRTLARSLELSKLYLLEETAVFSLMFKYNPAIDIYPGTTLLPCTIFQGRSNIPGLPDGLGQGAFAQIDFAKNSKIRNK